MIVKNERYWQDVISYLKKKRAEEWRAKWKTLSQDEKNQIINEEREQEEWHKKVFGH